MKDRTETAGAKVSDGAPDELVVESKLRQLIVRSIQSPGYKPPMLPRVAQDLMRLANDPKTNFNQVEKVLSMDQAMTAKIVKIANSALFSRGTEVRSLKTAVARLGLVRIRDISFQVVSEARLFRVKEYQPVLNAEMAHARSVAILAREVCSMLFIEKNMAFLCGLLHDVGKAIAFGIVADWAKKKKRPLPEPELLYYALERNHAAIGAGVVETWDLPPIISNSVRLHHEPFQKGSLNQMAAAVAIADMCSVHAGIGRPATSLSQDKLKIFYAMNMNPEQVKKIIDYSFKVKEDLETGDDN
ncbi:MAG: HDOD domain-containing protein [Deltaproteobacteria bacterium]|nr:HDOD domain-containing protein [Deltaproteobacteria bacterium]